MSDLMHRSLSQWSA